MSTIVNTIQEIIRQEMRTLHVAELGLVEKVFPHRGSSDKDNYGCDVRVKNSGLLLKRVPLTTGHIGTATIPNVGDLVLVNFDHGDVNQPIIVGRLYNEKARPPVNDSNEVIFRLPLDAADDKTIKGAIRNLPAKSTPREIIFEMPPKITMRVTDGTVRATAGKTEMKLDQPGGSGGTVTVLAGRTKITMNQDGDIKVEAAGSMTLSADGDVSISGQNIKIESKMNTEVSAGLEATVKARMGATMDGGLASTVKGASISIKGMTSFSPG